MKLKLFISVCILMISLNTINAQNLVTKKTYWDWSASRLHEIFTVIAGTGTMHGSYKEYNQSGELIVSANYNKNMLHGVCTNYLGSSPNRILKTTTYVNGVKNGEEKDYTLYDEHCLSAKSIYKDDKVIEKTFYYTESAYKGRKERYIKFDVDKTYTTDWYKDGKIAYDGVEDRMGNPIQFTKNNAEGAVIQKCENNVTTTYTDDGKMLKQKEDLNIGLLEDYDNGVLVKTVRTFKENDEELHEIILYSDNKPSSKQLLNKDGKDVEVLRKQKRLEIQYDSLYQVLKEIYPLEIHNAFREKEERKKSQYYKEIYKPYRRASYESDEKSSFLNCIYRKLRNNFDKMANERLEFSSQNSRTGFIKDQTAIDKLSAYINKIRHENIAEDYEKMSSIAELIDKISNDLYYVECVYTDYRGYKDIVPNKHKTAYNAYITVIQYLQSRLENETLSNTFGVVELYATVCAKMRKWENEKISSIEKLLKKAQNPEEQLLIFIKNDINQN